MQFYRRMVQRLKEMFPNEPALRNTRTMNLLKMLLHIEGTGTYSNIQSFV